MPEPGSAKPYSSPPWRAFIAFCRAVDRRVGWDPLPTPLGLLLLVGIRNGLRRDNLHDTRTAPAESRPPVAPPDERVLGERTADGSYDDLDDPAMGMAGERFGRNVPIERTWQRAETLMTPNPRAVSRALLTRHPWQPATTVNNLVTAWLQFMLRDWFSHGHGDPAQPWTIELDPDDPFPERPMQVPRTRRDPTRPPGSDDAAPPTYVNATTHWWDGSSIYGATLEHQRSVRTGTDGKLVIGADGRLPVDPGPTRDPTREPGFWTGLLMMQTLFTMEHNSICDRLRAEHPRWADEQLFQRARLVNAALLAKIHTIEWTPAVISHPTTVAALRANWYGLAGERAHRMFGRISKSDVVSGIPGAQTDHFGVPYSLTEEFVAVYRMHPLVADAWSLRAHDDDSRLAELTFRDLTGPAGYELTEWIGLVDLFYSFGTEHPGLVCLHNHPLFLQEFERPDGRYMDLGAVDLLRTRELGVPRYCELRRLLHMRVPKTFAELTRDPGWAAELERVYGDVEDVDLMVGMYAEPLPKGFAFSDTAFRIFVLMASRRLNSDRFLTRDYRPEIYTQAGIDWVEGNSMRSVLLRHLPELADALDGVKNAFAPWTRAA